MATSDTYTLVVSELGIPASHASSHAAGGTDEVSVNISQLDNIAANTLLGNLTGSSAAVTTVATTGTGNVVRATGPTITLANATGLPLTTGVTGVLPIANGGTGVSSLNVNTINFLQTPTSANLKTLVSDETGSGLLVFGTSPALITPTINGTTAATNTGTGALVFGTSPTISSPSISNPTISGSPTFSSPISVANGGTGVNTLAAGAVSFLQTPTSANLRTLVSDEVGTGSLVFGTSPVLTTPTINGTSVTGVTGTGGLVLDTSPTIASATLSSPTISTPTFSSPLSVANGGTGISSLGAGVATFLGAPSSATLRGAITDETGTGLLVFANNPIISSPTINGTPVFSNPLTAANGGTGLDTLGAGIPVFLETPSSDSLNAAITDSTGTGSLVFGTNAALVTPSISSPTIGGSPTFVTPLSVANGGTGVGTLNANAVPFLQTPTSANLRTLVTDEQGTGGGLVFATSPTLTTATLVSPTITSPTFTAPLPVASGGTGVTGAARGCLSYIAGTATQVLATQNVYTQLSIGTPMTLSNAQDVVLGAANTATLRYNTTFTGRYFLVSVHVNLDAGTNADLVGLKLYSGAAGSYSAINETEIKWRLYHSGGTTLPADMIVSWILPLSPFEEVSAYIANFSAAARTLNINSVRMTLHAIV